MCCTKYIGCTKYICHPWRLVDNWLSDYQIDVMIGLFFNPCCDSYFIYALFTWGIVEQMLADFFLICMDLVSFGNIEFKH